MNLEETTTAFMDASGAIDKEGLRVFALKTFKRNHAWAEYLLSNPKHRTYWNNLNDYVQMNPKLRERDYWLVGMRVILGLHLLLDDWMKEYLETAALFDFVIEKKAAEINSGDPTADYYNSLQWWHDLLMGAVFVFEDSLKKLAVIMELSDAAEVVRRPSFLYFCDKSVHDRIEELSIEIFKGRSSTS